MSTAEHLYVHVPFCSRRCSYCDFSIAVRRTVPVKDFVAAVANELSARTVSNQPAPLISLYVGGGTPSKLGPAGVELLLDTVRKAVGTSLAPGAEVTLEANPEDVSPEAARSWFEAGINRLSLGAQTFDERALHWMHRTHDSGAVTRAVEVARVAGFDDISLDLIFALPTSIGRSWSVDLSRVLELNVDHLSLYGLTVEPRTPVGRWAASGLVTEAPEERYATEFLIAHDVLAAAGFDHYEVSNFARPSKRSRHNSSYWRRVPYLGVGPSAHSYDGVSRRWNERAYEAWRTRAARGEDPIEDSELLTDANAMAECVYLGLRTSEGLEMREGDSEIVSQWQSQRWAVVNGNRILLSVEGWLRLDSLSAALTASRSR